MAQCSIDECDNEAKYVATGWCQTHYHRYWRNGSTDAKPKEFRTDLTYYGAHCRVRRTLGAASKYPCTKCGEPAHEWAYDGTDPTARTEYIQGQYKVSYSVWPEFYMPMCFRCHRIKDGAARASRRTHCTHMHEMTPENTYTRPSRPGTRECNTCKVNESSARYLRKKADRELDNEPR